MTRGRIAGIGYSSEIAGSLPRRAVFFQGCSMRCRWCNRMERAFDGRGSSWEELGVNTVMERLARLEPPESGSEISISGGEPLAQPEFLIALLDACREKGIPAAVETTLYARFSIAAEVARRAARLLVNLRLMDSARHLRLTGLPSAPILKNIEFLSSQGAPIVLRFQLIPGVNDLPGDIEAAADFASMLQCPSSIEILPYHGFRGPFPAIHAGAYGRPSEEGLRRAARVFESYGLEVRLALPA
jgi:pyruvate formate lyase activating enzyme